MRFRQSSTSPPYLNRRDQFRMLRMVGLLALVLFAINFAGESATWQWLFPGASSDWATEQKQKPSNPSDVDYDVKFEEDSPLPPDAFRAQAPPRRSAPRNAPGVSHRPGPAIAEASPHRSTGQAEPPAVDSARPPVSRVGDYVVEIDPEILAPVSDDWVGIRRVEAPAFYAVIAKAHEIPLRLLEDAGRADVDYTVLMTDSEQFRGVPLTIQGTIRRLKRVPLDDPSVQQGDGLDHFFEGWMFTPASGTHPYRIICTSLPEGIPQGDDIEVPAKFTGYFFKREGYESLGGFHKAPVLIGKHVRWLRSETAFPVPKDLGLVPYVTGFAVVIALWLALMIWRFSVSDKQFDQRHLDQLTTTPDALQALEKVDVHDPAEFFRQLEAQELAAENKPKGES